MINNTLMIAAAGSGKTTFLVNQACSCSTDTVLITTYTEANEKEIRDRIIAKMGCMPVNITVQTWFSFLLQHGVRPYQSELCEDIHDENIGFYLLSEKSGKKVDSNGKPILIGVRPVYWGAKDFKKYYFTSHLKVYSDKISKFVFETNKASKDKVVSRIARLFQHVFIDEIQDLAGYDLELIKLLFKSNSTVLLVGDPRQVTYLTHHSTKFGKYSDGGIKSFIENELGKKIECKIDEATLNPSHRNNKEICHYSSKLYPALPAPKPCDCIDCRKSVTDHEGVFLIKPKDVNKYLSYYKPMQLRWSSAIKCNSDYPARNFGESKGLTLDRVLIYPTQEMKKWIKDNGHSLKNEARAKLYVAVTRAKNSVAIVMNFDAADSIDGLVLYDEYGNF